MKLTRREVGLPCGESHRASKTLEGVNYTRSESRCNIETPTDLQAYLYLYRYNIYRSNFGGMCLYLE